LYTHVYTSLSAEIRMPVRHFLQYYLETPYTEKMNLSGLFVH